MLCYVIIVIIIIVVIFVVVIILMVIIINNNIRIVMVILIIIIVTVIILIISRTGRSRTLRDRWCPSGAKKEQDGPPPGAQPVSHLTSDLPLNEGSDRHDSLGTGRPTNGTQTLNIYSTARFITLCLTVQ